MERINLHNYEAFFLDYIEGNLKDSYKSEFERFLRENPGLKEELEQFEDIKLNAEDITFENKEELIKKTQSKHFEISDFEYLCVGDLENDLDSDELKDLQKKLEGSLSKREVYDLIKNAKLKPDLNISYPYKKRLQRRVLPQAVKIASSVAAAIVTLVLVLNQIGNIPNSNVKKYSSSGVNKNYIIKPVEAIQTNTSNIRQEALNSHNQTIKQIQNSDLAFDDNGPHENKSLYKELTVSIPDIKSEALIIETNDNIVLASNYPNADNKEQARFNKDDLWKYAETGVTVWKLISSDDFEMKNEYKKDGSIEKLNLVASNFKFSKTFNRK